MATGAGVLALTKCNALRIPVPAALPRRLGGEQQQKRTAHCAWAIKGDATVTRPSLEHLHSAISGRENRARGFVKLAD